MRRCLRKSVVSSATLALSIARNSQTNAFNDAFSSGRSLVTSRPSAFASLHSPSVSRALIRPQRFSSSLDHGDDAPSIFGFGDSVLVEVISFGPMGASVDVVGRGHDTNQLIPDTNPPLGRGIVLQREIYYFRQARNNVDVVKGEILKAFVEKVREDGRLDIALRTPGGKAKAQDVGMLVLERLERSPSGSLDVGDKSSPTAIQKEFPGVSKAAFKKAVSALYKQGRVQPGPDSIRLMIPKQE